MESYLDFRTLLLKEYEYLSEPTSLQTVIVFSLPGNKKVELDEVYLKIEEIISKKDPFGGYDLQDIRRDINAGASSSWQEIVFQIMLGVGGNISFEIIKDVFSWAKYKIYKNEKMEDLNTEEYIYRIKDIVSSHFSPTENILMDEIEKDEDRVKLNLTDDQGNKYYAELFPDGKIIKIKKQP